VGGGGLGPVAVSHLFFDFFFKIAKLVCFGMKHKINTKKISLPYRGSVWT
jgi:hypothetical protein